MATIKNISPFKGTILGLCFYESGGRQLVRKSNPVSRKRILTDSAYRVTRLNMKEFGASASIGKDLRTAIPDSLKKNVDSTFVGRLVKVLRGINLKGEGTQGSRCFPISKYKDMLNNFEFNVSRPLSNDTSALFQVECNEGNQSMELMILKNSSLPLIKNPENATHFQFMLSVSLISDYFFNEELNSYHPVASNHHGKCTSSCSDIFPISSQTDNIRIPFQIENAFPLPPNQTAVVCMSLQFYKEIEGVFVPYKITSTKIIAVF